ncbi:outer membrane lipoprotein-sorting protein, partial [Pseudomonas ogarae]
NAGAVDSKGFLADPFANEKPLFTITAATVDKYKDKLSEGQVAMFKRYPQTYKIPVYPTHRSVGLPPEIYESAKRSALNVTSINDGNGLSNFTGNRYYAFPIPKNGVEVLWNHVTRYHGGNLRRVITQVTPQTNGSFTPIRFEEEIAVPFLIKDADPEKASNVLTYFKQSVTAPARLAGNVLLVHETLDQVKEPRLAWIYNAGQRRVRRAPQVAYDGPGTAADGLRTSDNFDLFSGAPDRYDWKLIGKKEMYIPYNSYKLDSPSLKYDDVIKAGHINQDLTRYELHRVWEVEGTVKPSERQ